MTEPEYFHEKLWELLPDVYREKDQGDLDTFLHTVSPSLDEFKALIDKFPTIFDVQRCDPKFMPFLAQTVGLEPVGTDRRDIQEAVETYRRKGTIPAIERSLEDQGWQGEVEETYRKALRLNRRPVLGRMKLPGLIYSLGVYRLHGHTPNLSSDRLREILAFHHPAGTKVFFLQWLNELLDISETTSTAFVQWVERIAFKYVSDAFILNTSNLNGLDHLTQRCKTKHLWEVSASTLLKSELEGAGTCFSSWHARRSGFRLNSSELGEERLVNLWIDQRRYKVCCEVETSEPRGVDLRLGVEELNRSRFPRAQAGCSVFRNRELVAEVESYLAEATVLFTILLFPSPPTLVLEAEVQVDLEDAGNFFALAQWPATMWPAAA